MMGVPDKPGLNPATSTKPLDYTLGSTPPPPQVTHRSFTDYPKIRQNVFDNALKAMSEKYPIENQRHRLELREAKYEDLNPFTLKDQKKAIMEGGTLQKKILGTWALVDKATGKVMDQKATTVAHVPWMTQRGTFIFNGNEYTVANQMRLKPGIFTRVRENGVLEAHVNVKPGTGPSFRIYMEPDTGVFRLGVGQSNLKLYPILRSMGVSDHDITKHWGPEILQKNIEAEDPRAVARAYMRLVNVRSEESAKAEGAAMDKEASLFGVDPDFDKAYREGSELTSDLFDPPAEIWSRVCIKKSPVEGKGLFASLNFDAGETIFPAFVFTGIDKHNDSIKRSVPARWLNHSDTPNIELYEDGDIVWARALKPIQAGEELLPDYVQSHEAVNSWVSRLLPLLEKSAKIGARESDRRWTKLWYTGRLIHSRHNQKDWVLLKVHKGLCEATYDSLKAEGIDCEPKFDQPHISIMRPEEVEQLKKKFGNSWQGAAKIGHPMRFSVTRIVNLVPAGWDKYDRVWFLECSSPDLEKYREDLGLPCLPQNNESGHDMRFHITVAVHPNTVSKAAELLCEKRAAAFDDVGSGTNAVSPRPDNQGKALLEHFQKMEVDPEVTSATLGQAHTNIGIPTLMRTTQKLINVSRETEDTDDRDSLSFQTLHGPEDFFAERVKRDAGMIGRKMLWRASARGNLKHVPAGVLTPQLHSVLLNSGMGMPLEETNPLDIFDQNQRILRLGEGAIPSIEAVPDEARSVQPSHFGFIDPVKAPECYDEATEVMVETGWKPWPKVTESDRFACLINGRLEYHHADRLIAETYKGQMYGADTQTLSYLVTPNHRMWVRPQGSTKKDYNPTYRFELPDEIVGTNRLFRCGGHAPVGGTRTGFTLPVIEADGKENQIHGNPPIGSSLKVFKEVDINDWAEFMGWYLSEGSLNGQYVTRITQSNVANPENCLAISRLLNRLPFTWCFVEGDTFTISSKQLNSYLTQFGFCNDKFIPSEIWEAPVLARELFLRALLAGDGRTNRYGRKSQLCTTSRRLADDVQLLAFQLGHSTRISFEKDERKDTYLGCYIVNIHAKNERLVVGRSAYHPDGQYRSVNYDGKVYCATVPGGLLYVRRGNSAGFWCGNSEKIGVDLRVAHGAVKGSDGQFYTTVKNVQSGERELVSASSMSKSVVAFPGEMNRDTPKVRAMVNSRRVEYVPRDDVQYELPHGSNMFAAGSNMVPMIGGIKGGRLLMGSRMVIQALPLKGAEAPLVRSAGEDGNSFENLYSEYVGAVRAKGHGVIEHVDPDKMVVRYKNGERETHELYNNMPFNRKTLIHSTPLVKIGDTVRPNQLMVHSNYTDREGNIALGRNLRVAYMPYHGSNFEDATVISESAAKKLSSEHMYQVSHEVDKDTTVGRKEFVSIFPAKYPKDGLKHIDTNGVVKPGSIVKHGDPLVLSMQKGKIDALHRGHSPMWSDKTTEWHHTSDGLVTDVAPTKDGGWNIIVKSYAPMQEGDKMSGRYGDKGIVSKILPDHQMVHDKDGRPFDVILNPLGIVSRINPSQVVEAALGKVSEHTGKPYSMPAFMEDDLIGHAQKELAKHGLSDTEDVFDPTTGRKIPKVFTGNRFIMKLHHTAESKGRGRDIGGYTAEGLPARGGEGGSKRIGQMEQAALLSHGATEVLKDAQIVRGQRNDDWWSSFRRGLPPPSPKVPFVYDKFLNYMKGAGINTDKRGDRIHLMALTDKDVEKMSSGAITSRDTVRGDTMEEIPGGLFDRHITGGHNGDRWGHIALAEPLPNPVFEEPIRTLLGLTASKFSDVLAGKEKLGGNTGSKAIYTALNNIKTGDAIKYYEGVIKDGRKSARDKAIKALGYLRGLEKGKLNPVDLMMSKVPVVPPNMRPITVFRKMTMVADPNYLYRDLMFSNDAFKAVRDELGEEHSGDERLNLYNSFKATTGLGDPVQAKTKDKGVRGLLAHVFGSGSPKFGMFQRRVLSSSVDEVGRATITVNPELNMDEVGLPEPKAWVIYRPFITRRLVRRGMPMLQAAKEVANQSRVARDAMMEEITQRPVIINRAPVLHRYGFMAAWPKLVKGETLHVPPVVCSGFNADFDGDNMNYHVPATDGAVKDAVEKMMPSRNLRSVRNFGVQYTPKNEFLLGLYLASKADNKNEPKVFANKKAVMDAWKRGEIDVGDRIVTRD
jgi:DNA-directed RNA polymerase beta subunit